MALRTMHDFRSRTLSCSGALHFASYKNYIQGASDSFKAYANYGAAASWSNTNSVIGGTLHGTWAGDGSISTSDRRLKENIRELQQTLAEGKSPDILRELRPVSYTYKGASGLEAGQTRFGFVADEMMNALPQITRTLPQGDEDKLGLVYQDLLAFLTAQLQSFSKEMSTLMPRLASIEGRIRQRRKRKRKRAKKRRAAARVAAVPSVVV